MARCSLGLIRWIRVTMLYRQIDRSTDQLKQWKPLSNPENSNPTRKFITNPVRFLVDIEITSEQLISFGLRFHCSFRSDFGMSETVQSGQCLHSMKNSESNEDSRPLELRESSCYSFLQITLTFQGAGCKNYCRQVVRSRVYIA